MTPRLRTRDFRIAQQFQLRRVPILEAQEIEPAHFVGAVVRAIPRADAAVVNHVVQAFRTVHGRIRPGRPARKARFHTACMARAGKMSRGLSSDADCIRMRSPVCLPRGADSVLGIVAIHADPVHFAAAHHLILTDDRNVVFRLAGHDTCAAAIALVQINRHAPGIAGIRKLFVERIFLFGVSTPSCANAGFF